MAKIKTSISEQLYRLLSFSGFGISAFATLASMNFYAFETAALAFCAAGVGYLGFAQSKKLRLKHEELSVLQYIHDLKGRASLPDIMLHFGLTAELTRDIVERLHEHNIIASEVTANGEILYLLQDGHSRSNSVLMG